MTKAVPKILVVDDEHSIAHLISSYLRKESYDVRENYDGPAGLQSAREWLPDVIILDVMLPGMDGLEVLAQLRRFSNAYVILLTARTEEVDKIIGLTVGADDYVTKPFSPRELTARVKAALRRLPASSALSNAPGPEWLVFKTVRINISARQAWLGERLLDLTAMEFDLLRVMAEHRGHVLSRQQLLEMVWGSNYFGDLRVVDVHIGHLRQKLDPVNDLVVTVRGAGYRFDDERR